MLVTKSYFLSDMERFEIERVVFESNTGKTAEEIFALDDRELMNLYSECLEKKPVALR